MKDNSNHEDDENGYELHQISLDNDFASKHPKTVQILSKHQLIYSILGIVLGLAAIIGGIALFLNGIAGSMSWTASFLGAESNINDAAPGAILFIVGLFIVFITRYVFKIKK